MPYKIITEEVLDEIDNAAEETAVAEVVPEKESFGKKVGRVVKTVADRVVHPRTKLGKGLQVAGIAAGAILGYKTVEKIKAGKTVNVTESVEPSCDDYAEFDDVTEDYGITSEPEVVETTEEI